MKFLFKRIIISLCCVAVHICSEHSLLAPADKSIPVYYDIPSKYSYTIIYI